MKHVKINIDAMSMNGWDEMKGVNVSYILNNPNRVYEVKEVTSNGDIILNDDVLSETSFYESEVIWLTLS